ncbi:unnamed protein product [Brassica napus]|uniref:(rape) hypothetical protein n=1 Tax=Brassica napus TaxID=3708 RepID=A0A816NZW4_BRANA|nr:unnamed protein product [Brassica napus]
MEGVVRTVDLTDFDGYNHMILELEKLFNIEGKLHMHSQWKLTFKVHEGDMMLVGDDSWLCFILHSFELPIRAEGNTTFLDGRTWCVARPSASQAELQRALDWGCGIGRVDCSVIEKHGDCYEPDTIWSHASFAFNVYYHTNGNNRIACYFGGTATLTKINPSKFLALCRVLKLIIH